MLRAALVLALAALPAHAQIERFIVKDKLTTLRLVTLEGNRVEERIYDEKGFANLRVIDLDMTALKEDLPGAGAPPPDGTRVEETPLGRVRTTYSGGLAIARSFLSRKRPTAAQIAAMLEGLVGAKAMSVDPFAPPGGFSGHGLAYMFYGRLGLFVPWRIEEQALFGSPVPAGGALPGDLIFLGPTSRSMPERVALAAGGGDALLAESRKAEVVRMPIRSLPGKVLSVRRVLGSPWEGYVASAPGDLIALAKRRGAAQKPAWNRIQGLASFYDHFGSESLRAASPVGPAMEFVPGAGQLHKPASAHVFTLAHKSLAIGTRCRVTVLETKKSVVCQVADRGNFESERSFEVCYEAAQELGLDQLGVAVVEVELLEPAKTASAGAKADGAD